MNGELGSRLPMTPEEKQAIADRLAEAQAAAPPEGFSRRQWRAVEAICMVYDVEDPHVLFGWARTHPVSHARQVAMAAIWKLCKGYGRERVAAMFNKDKQPVRIAYIRVVERMSEGDPLAIEAWNLARQLLEE